MKSACFKLISKRERWGLTAWGWLVLITVFIVVIWLLIKNIVPFLSYQKTIPARVMVVEGYIPDYAFEPIIKIFKEENYDLLIATGTTYDQGFYISGLATTADLIGKSLLGLGFDSTKIAIVPATSDFVRDRTYHTGIAVKYYLEKFHPEVTSFNMISMGAHARRSMYLYRLAFGSKFGIGNIVIPEKYYNKDNWYKSSVGFRTVVNESLGYFYVRWFFAPERRKK